ncbi:MAG: hypothetical protein KCHDKBKB_00432 [Elusimicrobia bacterium]|nr:hypothetical protein [Elusimicrobiota bacterium]
MKHLSTQEIEFARFAGELAESLSFNKSVGQIFGLLYLSSTPLSLDEISTQLSMSKGNASINLRYLESWGAVRSVAMSGTRRDHYEANKNLKEIVLRRVEEGIVRRLDLAEERMVSILSLMAGVGTQLSSKKKIQEFQKLIHASRQALKLLPMVFKFFPKS